MFQKVIIGTKKIFVYINAIHLFHNNHSSEFLNFSLAVTKIAL